MLIRGHIFRTGILYAWHGGLAGVFKSNLSILCPLRGWAVFGIHLCSSFRDDGLQVLGLNNKRRFGILSPGWTPNLALAEYNGLTTQAWRWRPLAKPRLVIHCPRVLLLRSLYSLQ